MSRILAAAAVMVLILASSSVYAQRARNGAAQPAIIEKADGAFERGWITREGDKRTFIDLAGKTSDVEKTDKVHSVGQMMQAFRRAQQNAMSQDIKDLERYTRIMTWAKDHGLYEQVAEYAQKSIRLNLTRPDPEAEANLKMAREKLAVIKAGPAASSGDSWTMEDVQKVRFALLPKVGTNAGNLQVTFKNNAVKRFLEAMTQSGRFAAEDEQKFRRLPATQQAQRIKQETGDEYQPDIVIGRDPLLITEFNKTVLPVVMRSCATASCHGGTQNVPLKLLSRPVTIPDRYAEFYALDNYRGEAGPLLSHAEPEKSPFLTYLLPANFAPEGKAHPRTKPALVPAFRSKKDSLYVQVVKWLKMLPSTEGETPATAAATQPAASQPVKK